MKKKGILTEICCVILLIAAAMLCGCTKSEETNIITDYSQLNGKTVAYIMGASYADQIEKAFPDSTVLNFNSVTELLQALKSNRIDAYFIDSPVGLQQIKETSGIKLLGEPLIDEQYGFIFNSESTELQGQFNKIIQRFRKDGTLDMLEKKWVLGEGDPNLSFDESIPTPNGVLEVGVEVNALPFAYMAGKSFVGYDVELLYLICAELGYKPHLVSYPFTALLPAVTSGRATVGFGCITYTAERAKTMLFSDSTYNGGPVAMIRDGNTDGVYTSLSEIDGKNIGYLEGSVYIDQIEKILPNSSSFQYASHSEIIQALKTGRIDAYITDEPMAKTHIRNTDGLMQIDETLSTDNYGFIFDLSDAQLRDDFNKVLSQLREDGALDRLKEKWILGEGDSNLSFDESIPTPNGELHVAVAADTMPFAYFGEDMNIVGYDIELLYLICAELGYKPTLSDFSFTDLINTLTSDIADIGIGCITYTEERAEAVLFSDSTYESGTVAVVLGNTNEDLSFFESLKKSFIKNLITEDRWKMIVDGLFVTIELSVLSLIFGTLLGFIFSFMLRSKNKFIAWASSLLSMILDGLPLLIILMVFYYIIFARAHLSSIIIGITGLSLDFANCVAGILNTGIKAIDKGQIEAAEAMGYSKLMVFKKIIFPQVANQMFDSYSGSIISLVKGTSIIGYIAIEDLTKATDIIRSRTFEAFFPLVLTAIIYFIIARIFISLLSYFANKLDPKHRARRVKGVKYSD